MSWRAKIIRTSCFCIAHHITSQCYHKVRNKLQFYKAGVCKHCSCMCGLLNGAIHYPTLKQTDKLWLYFCVLGGNMKNSLSSFVHIFNSWCLQKELVWCQQVTVQTQQPAVWSQRQRCRAPRIKNNSSNSHTGVLLVLHPPSLKCLHISDW